MQNGWVHLLARFGYGARGTVYLLVGGLALAAAIAAGGGGTAGSKEALAKLSGGPVGATALIVIGVGLFGYSLWRCAQGLLDTDGHGTDTKGIVIRGGLLISAVTHTLLGFYAISLVVGSTGDSGGSSGSEGAAAWLMQQPFGRYLLGMVAVAIIGAGAAQIWKGCSGKFRKRLEVPGNLSAVLYPVCAFGLVARGLVFLIVGTFFSYAAFTVDPDQAGGLSSALKWVESQSYGSTLLAVIAAGLLAFGIYCLIEAAWRRIDASKPEHRAQQAARVAKRAAT